MGTVCKLMVLSNALRCSLSLDGFTSALIGAHIPLEIETPWHGPVFLVDPSLLMYQSTFIPII